MEAESTASISSAMSIIEEFKELYGSQLQSVDATTFEGLKMKTKILENYVKDLTDQNSYLLQTVEELESESLKRLHTLEEHLASKIDSSKFDGKTGISLSELESRASHLCNDIWNLLELIRRLREDGFWYLDGLSFKTVTYQDIFGVPKEKCDCKCKLVVSDCKEIRSRKNPAEKIKKKCCCSSFNSK